MQNSTRNAVKAILLGGLAASTLDIFAASLINMLSPMVILRAIASGLMGPGALHGGGLPASIAGLLLQWAMGIIIAAIYMLATRTLPATRRRWIPMGILAGTIIYFVMTYVVVSLSAAPFRHEFGLAEFMKAFTMNAGFFENLVAMWVFGLIVAWFAKDVGRS